MRKLLCIIILVNGVTCKDHDLDARLRKLDILVKEHATDTQHLKGRLASLEKHVSDIDMEGIEETRHNPGQSLLNDELNPNRHETDINEIALVSRRQSKRLSGEDVAFHAYLSSSRQYSNHEIFMFDTVTLNTRGGYTSYDGIFGVPVGGVYVFSWTVAVPASGGQIITELIAHGTVIGVITSDPDHENQPTGSGVHPATGFAVAQVSAGNNVFIRMRNIIGRTETVLSDTRNVRTSFSAWLLV